MNHKELLDGAKAIALNLLEQSLAGLARRSADGFFSTAYKTTNFTQHRLYLDAYTLFNSKAREIEKQLAGHADALLSRGIVTAYNSSRPSLSDAQSMDHWALVDAMAVENDIRVQKVATLINARCEQDIKSLNLRIAALFGQDNVRERENPFRPYLFALSLFRTVDELQTAAAVSYFAVDQLAASLLPVVAEIYRELNAYFEKHGISARLRVRVQPSAMPAVHAPAMAADRGMAYAGGMPTFKSLHGRNGAENGGVSVFGPGRAATKVEQLYRLVRKRADPARRGDVAGIGTDAIAAGPAAQASLFPEETHGGYPLPAWLSDDQAMKETLQRLFNGESVGRPRTQKVWAGTDSDGDVLQGTTIAGIIALDWLQQFAVPSAREMTDTDGRIRNLIMENRGQFAGQASHADEMMTIDVVALIFEFILRDGQVPAEIRAQLGRLQFHILKIALQDPQFLANKAHPARMLINRIGTVSNGLDAKSSFAALMTAEVQRVVEAMLADEAGDVALIGQLFEEFQAFVAVHLQSGSAGVEGAIQAVQNAQKRSMRHQALAAILRGNFKGAGTDPYLERFIFDAWLLAVERAEQEDLQLAQRYRELVPELLWSVLGKGVERERARLLAHLPQMLHDLKAGLASIKYTERQEFLAWLIESHAAAIKGNGYRPEQPSLSELRARFKGFIDGHAGDERDAQESAVLDPELEHRFLQETVQKMSIKLEDIETIMEFGATEATQTAPGSPAAANLADAGQGDVDGADNIAGLLQIGVPVEINIDGAPQKGILNWMSANAASMVLSFEGKTAPTAISVTLFRRLLKNGRARFFESAPLFERAVSSFLETAESLDEIYS